MAFWSDLGKKISDTTQSVVEKTKISTDTMRLNGLISDEERNVQRIYAEIGRKYMELHGADGDPDFAGLMQEYQTSKAKMEEYRSQIRRLSGRKIHLAFVPADPRLMEHQFDGMNYFLEHTDADYVFPMHMWQDYSALPDYRKRISNAAMAERVVEIKHENQIFEILEE